MTVTGQQFASAFPNDDKIECSRFNHLTRYFELSIDICADPLTRLAFASEQIAALPLLKKVAVNGELDDIAVFFAEMFIWPLSDICEVRAPVPLRSEEWLLLDADEVGHS
ncbi:MULTISPECIES: hypothetical protein [unclassified Agarivorans]|uniref:hypothetical protein n=1 Tax=unclassified Agarivorans TaxID=2636026 RepID=UPI003D7D1167